MDPSKQNLQRQETPDSGQNQQSGQSTELPIRLHMPLVPIADRAPSRTPVRAQSYRVHSAHGCYVFLSDADPSAPRRRYNGRIHRIDQLLAMERDPLLSSGSALFSFAGTSWNSHTNSWNYPTILDETKQASSLAGLLRRVDPADRAVLFARLKNLVKRYFLEKPSGGKDSKTRMSTEDANKLADTYIGMLQIKLADEFRKDSPEIQGSSVDILKKVLGENFEQARESGPEDLLTGVHLGQNTEIPDELKIQGHQIFSANVRSWGSAIKGVGSDSSSRLSIRSRYPRSTYDNQWDKQTVLGVFSTDSYSALVIARGSITGELTTELRILPGRMKTEPFAGGRRYHSQPIVINQGGKLKTVSPSEAMLLFEPKQDWPQLFAEAQAHERGANIIPYNQIADVKALRTYATRQLIRSPQGQGAEFYKSLLLYLPNEDGRTERLQIRSSGFRTPGQYLNVQTGKIVTVERDRWRHDLTRDFRSPFSFPELQNSSRNRFDRTRNPFSLLGPDLNEQRDPFQLRPREQTRPIGSFQLRIPGQDAQRDQRQLTIPGIENWDANNLTESQKKLLSDFLLKDDLTGQTRVPTLRDENQGRFQLQFPQRQQWNSDLPQNTLRWRPVQLQEQKEDESKEIPFRFIPLHANQPLIQAGEPFRIQLPEIVIDAGPQPPPRAKWLLDGLQAGKLRLTIEGVQILDPNAQQLREAAAEFSSKDLLDQTRFAALREVLQTRDPVKMMSFTDLLDPMGVYEAQQIAAPTDLQQAYAALREEVTLSPALTDALQLGAHLRTQADNLELHALSIAYNQTLTGRERADRHNLIRSWAERMRRVASEIVSDAVVHQLTEEKWVRPRETTDALERQLEEVQDTVQTLHAQFSFGMQWKVEDYDKVRRNPDKTKYTYFPYDYMDFYPEAKTSADFDLLLLKSHFQRFANDASQNRVGRNFQTRIPGIRLWIKPANSETLKTMTPESLIVVRETITALRQKEAELTAKIKAASEQEDTGAETGSREVQFTEEQRAKRAELAKTLGGDENLRIILGYHLLRDTELAIHSGTENEMTRELRSYNWRNGLYTPPALRGIEIAALGDSVEASLLSIVRRFDRSTKNNSLRAALNLGDEKTSLQSSYASTLRELISSFDQTGDHLKTNGEILDQIKRKDGTMEPDYYQVMRRYRIPGAEAGMSIEQAAELSNGYFNLMASKWWDEYRAKVNDNGGRPLSNAAVKTLWTNFFKFENPHPKWPTSGIFINPYARNSTPTNYPMTIDGTPAFGKHRYYSSEQEGEIHGKRREFTAFAQARILERITLTDEKLAEQIKAAAAD